MSGPDPVCPSPAQLRALVSAELSASDADAISQHIETCAVCEDALTDLEEHRGEFIEELRSAWNSDPETLATSSERIISGTEILTLPYQIKDYRVEEKIGEGGQGMVYRARHCKLDQDVAMKIHPLTAAIDNQRVERFWRQCTAHGKLKHASIVRATDAGEDADFAYLVMDYVNGIDLSHLIECIHVQLSAADACEIIRLAAEGLGYAHKQGIIHRDVKPSNIMLSMEGDVKVLDFGISADEANQNSDLTAQGQFLGTRRFAAPEQFIDTHNVDHRADVYGLGATLLMLLSGNPPNPVKSTSHEAIASTFVGIDGKEATELANVISLMLSPNPDDRPASMDHVIQSLTAFSKGSDLRSLAQRVSEGGTELTAVQPGVVVRDCTRTNWTFSVILAASAFLLGVGSAGVTLILRDKNDNTLYQKTLEDGDSLTVVSEDVEDRVATAVKQQRGVRLSHVEGQIVRDELLCLEVEALSEGFAVALLRTPDGAYHKLTEPMRMIPGTKLPTPVIDFDDWDARGHYELVFAVFDSLEMWPESVTEDRLPESHIENQPLAFQAARIDVEIPDREYRTASWVIRQGGSVQLHDDTEVWFSTVDDLPVTPFQIQRISLAGCRKVSDEDVRKRISNMKMLQNLSLANTSITDESLPYIATNTHLLNLLLIETDVTDSSIEELCKLKRLTYLDVSWTGVTSDGVMKLQAANDKLKKVVYGQEDASD